MECPQCGENLRVDSLNPLDLSYWDEEEETEEDDYQDSYEQMLEKETEFTPSTTFEDEENQDFQLPDKSSFLDFDEIETEESL